MYKSVKIGFGFTSDSITNSLRFSSQNNCVMWHSYAKPKQSQQVYFRHSHEKCSIDYEPVSNKENIPHGQHSALDTSISKSRQDRRFILGSNPHIDFNASVIWNIPSSNQYSSIV